MKTSRKKSYERGDFIEWLLMLLAISVVIFAILIPKTGRNIFLGLPDLSGNYSFLSDTTTTGGTTVGGSNQTGSKRISQLIPAVGSVSESSSGAVSISTGNARNEKDPMSEYIVLDNRSGSAINITGWRLENGKSARTYSVGGQAVRYASDTAIIPQGTRIISPNGNNNIESIILKPGEKAIVTTGGPGNISPYRLISFKENSCTRYLAEDITFSYDIEKSCVPPYKESGVSNLETQCRNFINYMQSCHTPEYGGRTQSGEECDGCVDGRSGLSSLCTNYLKSHFNYRSCLANHSADPDFEGDVWHVYLHRPWEMWDTSYEKISLYDSAGNLIAELSY